MPRIELLVREDASEQEKPFSQMEEAFGYSPNSFWTMAQNPPIFKAVGAMMDAFWYTDDVDEETRRLVTFAYSYYAVSHYSSAHCVFGARERGLERSKILGIFDFDWSPIYDERERAISSPLQKFRGYPK